MNVPAAIRVALPLGIGDVHWSCTKLRAISRLHAGRPIEAYVNCSPNHQSVHYLDIVPFVARAVQSDLAPHDVWTELPPNHRFPKWSKLEASRGWNGFDYVVVANGHLERGEHISTYFAELGPDSTDYTYDLAISAEDVAYAKDLAGAQRPLVYLSGVGPNRGFHNDTWSHADWVRTIRLLIDAGTRPLLVGANTSDDLMYSELICHRLGTDIQFVDNAVGKTSIPQYCALIRDQASVWVGLNSGGGIVSAMQGTPTVMLWSDAKFPIRGVNPRNALHPKMKTNWLSAGQLESGTYKTFSYGSPELTPEAVAATAIGVKR